MYRNKRFDRTPRGLAFFTLALILVIAGVGCDDSNTPAIESGVFVDAAVDGLHYESITHSGTTGPDGGFFYEDGETVTFSIGGLILGRGPAGPRMTPIDLVPDAADETHPGVVNRVRLIQSLDRDGDPENGITITPEIAAETTGWEIGFDRPVADFESDPQVTGLLDTLSGMGRFSDGEPRRLREMDAALDHFRRTLDNADEPQDPTDPGGEPGGGGDGGDGGGSGGGSGGGDSGGGDSGGGSGGGDSGGG